MISRKEFLEDLNFTRGLFKREPPTLYNLGIIEGLNRAEQLVMNCKYIPQPKLERTINQKHAESK